MKGSPPAYDEEYEVQEHSGLKFLVRHSPHAPGREHCYTFFIDGQIIKFLRHDEMDVLRYRRLEPAS